MVKYVCVTRYDVVFINNRCPVSLPNCMCAYVRTYVHSNFIIIFSPLLMFVAKRAAAQFSLLSRSRFGLISFPNRTVSVAPEMIYWHYDIARKYACTFRQFHLLMCSQIKSTPSHRIERH